MRFTILGRKEICFVLKNTVCHFAVFAFLLVVFRTVFHLPVKTIPNRGDTVEIYPVVGLFRTAE